MTVKNKSYADPRFELDHVWYCSSPEAHNFQHVRRLISSKSADIVDVSYGIQRRKQMKESLWIRVRVAYRKQDMGVCVFHLWPKSYHQHVNFRGEKNADGLLER